MAGHKLGTLEGGGGYLTLSNASLPPPPPPPQTSTPSRHSTNAAMKGSFANGGTCARHGRFLGAAATLSGR